MTDPKTAARSVAARLAARSISIRHKQALDLVAAGVGLANRHVLAKLPALPPIRRVNLQLLTSAASVLARHDLVRRQIIVEETSEALVPTSASTRDDSEYVIAFWSRKEGTEGETLFWSDADGWTCFEDATRYADTRQVLPDAGLPSRMVRWMRSEDAELREMIEIAIADHDRDDQDVDWQGHEPDTPGERPLDYDRLAVSVQRRSGRNPQWSPLEVALRDGIDRIRRQIRIHPDQKTDAVARWLDETDEAFRNGTPRPDEMRRLVAAAFEACGHLTNWIEGDDRLRAWFDAAMFPSILGERMDPEASGISMPADFYPTLQSAGLSIRQIVDAAAERESEDHDPVRDYVAIAMAAHMAAPCDRRVPPLEIAVVDGLDLSRAVLPSLSEDPDTPGGALVSWVKDADRTFRAGIPDEASLVALLDDGRDAVTNIGHMLPSHDPLNAWLESTSKPLSEAHADDRELQPLLDAWSADIGITPSEISDPAAFLASERGMSLVGRFVDRAYYCRWSPSNKGMDMAQATAAADVVIEAIRDKTGPDRAAAAEHALSSHLRHGASSEEFYDQEVEGEVSSWLDALESDLEDLGIDEDDFDRSLWEDSLRDPIVQRMSDEDRSSVCDEISKHDLAEVAFHLIPADGEKWDMVHIRGPFTKPEALIIDRLSQHALAAMGWTVGEYRKTFADETPASEALGRPRINPDRLIHADGLREIIENACSTRFAFVLYAQVPLTRIYALDLTQPITFSRCAIATYDVIDGTFQDIMIGREVTVRDGVEGRLHACTDMSPNEMIGFSSGARTADLFNGDDRDRRAASTEALQAHAAVDAIRISMPGAELGWRQTDDPLVLELEVETYDALQRPRRRRYRSTFSSAKAAIPDIEEI